MRTTFQMSFYAGQNVYIIILTCLSSASVRGVFGYHVPFTRARYSVRLRAVALFPPLSFCRPFMFSRLSLSFSPSAPKGLIVQYEEEGGQVSRNSTYKVVGGLNGEPDGISSLFIEDSLKVGDALDIEEYRVSKLTVRGIFLGTRLHFAEPQGLEALIANCEAEGAEISKTPNDADVIVTLFNEKQLDGYLVSPYWVHRVLRTGRLSGAQRPIDRPCPVESVADADRMLISCTGFTEPEERAEIEAMVRLMGAHYTPFLTPSNKVLIARDKSVDSAKMKRAREWGVKIVDLEWLDESFRKWEWVD